MSGQQALAIQDEPAVSVEASSFAMFERLAKDPNASVETIERLMALWERNEARRASMAFNSAMSTAQAAMRPVAADANNPQTRSKYASYEALDRVIRPIYTAHGFGLSFDTAEGAPSDCVRLVCDVTHVGGHEKRYHLDMPADGKGAKGGDVMTKTHAVGSAVTYGQRYMLKMIFNVAVSDDDDGQKASASGPPQGFESWWLDMEAKSSEGLAALSAAFVESREDIKRYALGPKREEYAALKRKAAGKRA